MDSSTIAHRQLASIVGGRTTPDGRVVASHRYRLGMAPAPDSDVYIVRLIGTLDKVAITFEARDFEHAFRRALEISQDMAEVAGHLSDGVVVSVEECDSIRDLGISED